MTHKGLDDLLAAGLRPRRLAGGDVPAFFAQVRARLFGAPPADTAQTPAPAPQRTQPVAERQRPPFPVDVFPATVAAFARRVAAAMGCPIDFIGVAILVVSGAAIGAARALQLKGGWVEKPGLYAVVVARPGTTKTPALRAVMEPIYEEQDRLYQDHKAARTKYEEGLAAFKEARRSRDDDQPKPGPPDEPPPLRHLFASDTTVEGLAANLEENRKGILLFRDELTAWVRSLDMYRAKGTDRQFFLSAWSGEMVKVGRKSAHGKPVILPHPFIAVLGGIQPDLLSELEAEGGKEDGFLHRILFSYPADLRAQEWTDEEVSDEDKLEWQIVLGRLLNLQPARPEGASERPKLLQLSPEGKQAFTAWHDRLVAEMNHEDFPPELMGPWAKLKAHCARFALVVHLLRVACEEAGDGQSEGQVGAEDVGRAERLCAYFQAHFRVVYLRLRQDQEDRMVDDLVRWMARKRLRRCTPRDVCRANVCGIRKSSEAEKLLQAAIDRGLGEADGGDSRQQRRRVPEVQAFVLKGDA
jgi:hypothetical protein